MGADGSGPSRIQGWLRGPLEAGELRITSDLYEGICVVCRPR